MAPSTRHSGKIIASGVTNGAGGHRHDSNARRSVRRLALVLFSLLATSALTPILPARQARAEECAAAALPSDVAPPAALYTRLRNSTDADLLAINFDRRVVAKTCAWIYQVKVLTTAGAVVELEFAAKDLNLVGARGPQNDREARDLLKSLGADPALLKEGGETEESGRPSTATKANQDGESSGSNSGSGGSSSGGSSGGGSGDSDSEGGGSGSGGSGSGGSGSGGSGDSGSGGGDSGGGEGGEGGGD
jgi:hypothetical protein